MSFDTSLPHLSEAIGGSSASLLYRPIRDSETAESQLHVVLSRVSPALIFFVPAFRSTGKSRNVTALRPLCLGFGFETLYDIHHASFASMEASPAALKAHTLGKPAVFTGQM